MTNVEYTEKALDHLDGLESHVAERVMDKVDEATEFTEHRLEKLTGWPYYKLRAGDYRAIVSWDREEDLILVKAIGHRRNVYDRHLPSVRRASPPR